MTTTHRALRFSLRGLLLFVLLAAGACHWLARERNATLARRRFRAIAGNNLPMITAEAFVSRRNTPCSVEKNVVPKAGSVAVAEVNLLRRFWGDEAIQAIVVPRSGSARQIEAAVQLFPEAAIVRLPANR